LKTTSDIPLIVQKNKEKPMRLAERIKLFTGPDTDDLEIEFAT